MTPAVASRVVGARSDTIMLIRADPRNEDDLAALVPARPDVPIYCQLTTTAHDAKINSAFANCGPRAARDASRI